MTSKVIESHINLLGRKVTDKVTGMKGVVTSISFDLSGCIQAVVTPSKTKDPATQGQWFDVTRLKVSKVEPAMNVPNYVKGYVALGKKGPADKPLP